MKNENNKAELELIFGYGGVSVDEDKAIELALPEIEALGESIIRSAIYAEAPNLKEWEIKLVIEEVKKELQSL